MAEPSRTFRDLIVWQEAYQLSLQVYGVTRNYPKQEMFGLASQMQRAVVSVCSNIAEGFGRTGPNDKDRFYVMAAGSLTELQNQILISRGIGHISDIQADQLYSQCEKVYRLLNAMRKANNSKKGE